MNKNLLKNLGITVVGIIGAIYVLFLVLPFIVSPILNNYIPQINEEINKATGLVSEIKNIRLVTTPKFTIGAKVGEFKLLTPDKKEIANANNFEVKMSLLPLLTKKIRVDVIKLQNIKLTLKLNKDGSFEIEKYFPETNEVVNEGVNNGVNESVGKNSATENTEENAGLPFGLKLSNHLPDIRIGNYDLNFVDKTTDKTYSIQGEKITLTDFVLNKGVKIDSNGKVILAGREQFNYNLKINNKIMPDIDLHEMVFNPQPAEEGAPEQQEININLLDILKAYTTII